MKMFTAVSLLYGILVFLEIPDNILARSPPRIPYIPVDRPETHEVVSNCGRPPCVQATCPTAAQVNLMPCVRSCQVGYICDTGYIREVIGGRCIPVNDCPPLERV